MRKQGIGLSCGPALQGVRAFVHSTRVQARAQTRAAEVDTRSRLTCRKQVAAERPARRPASPMLSEKCDQKARLPTQIIFEEKLGGHEKAKNAVRKEMPRSNVLANAVAPQEQTTKLQNSASAQASSCSKVLACPEVVPSAKSQTETRRGFFSWLVPFGGFFRRDEDEDYLEDCEEETIMEDDEIDELIPSPPEAKRPGFHGD
eukprot:CAMPEP_0114689300 /NCGR_PEP_ID=MMETSP0191-20121206/64371_1 /TAXON_ID=126664 /ORGANISM="Sorites sp." /LENGTH=202 /DNA_ID=CAMNT_0001977707 /DNA_START=192 /DNA_END=801 /DNA_ORIENTATION=-